MTEPNENRPQPFSIFVESIRIPQARGGSVKGNANCTWVIVAPPKNTINLYWNSFDLEESQDCQFDRVVITEGVQSHSYCGTTIPSVMSTVGNSVKINFISDSTVGSEGFSLTYSFNAPGSGKGVWWPFSDLF